MTSDELAEQLHRLVDQLARPERTAPIQPGDLVQIAPDADDAYSGLPGIVQRVYGPRVRVSVLRPHRAGMAFSFPLAVLTRIGSVHISQSFTNWAEDLDKTCAECRQHMREEYERARTPRRKPAREPAATPVKKRAAG